MRAILFILLKVSFSARINYMLGAHPFKRIINIHAHILPVIHLSDIAKVSEYINNKYL